MSVEMSGITKRYGPARALADVDLTIGVGEVVALAGENGSGKSTLMKVLAGAVVPDSGSITVDGIRRVWRAPIDALDAGIAMVAQELTVLPERPVYENIVLPSLRHRIGPVSRRTQMSRAAAVLRRLGVEDVDPAAPMRSLTTAQQSFVEIAKALAGEPRVLVLDEATSRLGPAEVEFLFRALRRLREDGLSTVLITHRITEMTDLADRAVVLRDARRVGELRGGQLNERSLVQLMVGRDISSTPPAAETVAASGGIEVRDVLVASSPTPISLTVRPGEIVGLAGLVGSGRTALIEALAGVRRRGHGAVSVGDTVVAANDVAAARRAGIGLVPSDRQRQGLIVAASVYENYTLGATRWHRLARHRAARGSAADAAREFGIKTVGVDQPIAGLSGGNQQKVVIARTLARRPAVLLLDEPSRGIDIGARAEIHRIIQHQAALGTAVLVASSEIAELLAICHRVLVLHQRTIVGELHGPDLTEERIGHLIAGSRGHVPTG
ncbi:sugar ABC transporter ATP-binding protein [Micromonospora sp. CPCC 206060]|uniref:sugar ABC transporter ATP-binding protein n=1 Tax=Micromonospora sp. CPCC 206060 TaxID=3122406 RepID=UPI002FEF1BB0